MKDMLDGKYLTVWEDDNVIFLATPFVTLNFDKKSWKAFLEDIKQLTEQK